MKIKLGISLALAAVLAACGAPEPPPQAPAPAAETAAPAPAAPETRTAQGQGRVTAVDPAAGTVTLAHEPVPALDWPAMTMAFKAAPTAPLDGIKVGDEVSFDLQVTAAGPEVTRIGPR